MPAPPRSGYEQTITGVPLWLVREYLVELGGTARGRDTVAGDGWVARFHRLAPRQVGALRVGRVRLTLEGSEDALARLTLVLDRKLVRAGG